MKIQQKLSFNYHQISSNTHLISSSDISTFHVFREHKFLISLVKLLMVKSALIAMVHALLMSSTCL